MLRKVVMSLSAKVYESTMSVEKSAAVATGQAHAHQKSNNGYASCCSFKGSLTTSHPLWALTCTGRREFSTIKDRANQAILSLHGKLIEPTSHNPSTCLSHYCSLSHCLFGKGETILKRVQVLKHLKRYQRAQVLNASRSRLARHVWIHLVTLARQNARKVRPMKSTATTVFQSDSINGLLLGVLYMYCIWTYIRLSL